MVAALRLVDCVPDVEHSSRHGPCNHKEVQAIASDGVTTILAHLWVGNSLAPVLAQGLEVARSLRSAQDTSTSQLLFPSS